MRTDVDYTDNIVVVDSCVDLPEPDFADLADSAVGADQAEEAHDSQEVAHLPWDLLDFADQANWIDFVEPEEPGEEQRDLLNFLRGRRFPLLHLIETLATNYCDTGRLN